MHEPGGVFGEGRALPRTSAARDLRWADAEAPGGLDAQWGEILCRREDILRRGEEILRRLRALRREIAALG
jgi:hypothetical protein